jgi:exodeoxyribonuclease V beta subunit
LHGNEVLENSKNQDTPEFDPFEYSLEKLKGKNLIEASAGTGKTFCIENIFVRYLLEGYPSKERVESSENIDIRDMLVVTFTNAATKELKSRINKRIEEVDLYLNRDVGRNATLLNSYATIDNPLFKYINEKERDANWKEKAKQSIKLARLDFDEANIFTIHSFCERVLTENAFESSKTFVREINYDEKSYIDTAVEDFWRLYIASLPAEFCNKLNELSKDKDLKSFGVNLDIFKSMASSVVKIMNPEILPNIKNYLYKEGLFKEVKDLKSKKVTLKADYENERENIRVSVSRNFDSVKSANILIELDNYFYDDDLTLFDDCILEDLYQLHTIFKCISKLNRDVIDRLKSIDRDFLIYLRLKLFDYVNERINTLKKKDKKITFSNQLRDLYEALNGNNGESLLNKIKSRYKIAMVDEFQDTDQIQYEILKKIFFDEDKTIFLIGDPKQSIYKFRGADIFAYLKAKVEVGMKLFTLRNNYRSSEKLIKGFNIIFGSLNRPFVFNTDDIDYIKVESGKEKYKTAGLNENIEIKYFNEDINNALKAEEDVCNDIVKEITKLLDKKNNILINDRPLKANDIAIVVFKNSQIHLLRKNLNNYQIPVVATSNESVFNSEEADELKKFLIAVSNPANEVALRTALTTSLFGKKVADIFKLRQSDEDASKLLNDFADYQKTWQNHGFYAMMMQLITNNELKKKFMSVPGGNRKLVNFLHLTELIHKASKIGVNGIYETIKWINDIKNDPNNSVDEYLLRLESDENAVQITTVHKSKGLEYPIVFFPFFWDEVKSESSNNVVTFHQDNKIYLDVGSEKIEDNRQESALEKLAEDVRLFYVAITRAACKCYIYYYYNASKQGGHNSRPSAMHYIFHYAKQVNEIPNVAAIRHYLKDKLPEYSSRIADLQKLADLSENSIVLSKVNDGEMPQEDLYTNDLVEEVPICLRKFAPFLKPRHVYLIESYSHLAEHKGYNEKEYKIDESYNVESFDEKMFTSIAKEKEEQNIFYFPKGEKAGSDLHKIMEKLDFSLQKEEIANFVKTELAEIYTDVQLNTLANTIYNILNIDLGRFSEDGSFCLKDIDKTKRLTELEFYSYFSNLKGLKDSLISYFEKKFDEGFIEFEDFKKSLNKITFNQIKGYLHGYTDLVFYYQNKYYIVDWKFNHLGYNYNNYKKEDLIKAISNANYYLQYYIYLLSLYKYLKYRDKNFIADDIGGVFYIFARGVQENGTTGIYFDRPIDFLKGNYIVH